MSVVSDSTFLVRLPSGSKAVYSVQPQHVNEPAFIGPETTTPRTLTQRCIEHGTQLAHEKDGRWYKPGGWTEIADLRTIALLERAPDAETPAVTTSWKPEVLVDGDQFSQNNLAFATQAEAEASARELAGRWMLVRDWRAAPSEQPVNARLVDGKLELLPQSVAS